MKKTAYFLLLLLLIGACGCRNRKTSYPPLIRQAEYWAEACPDSAIACLDSIDASLQELTEEELAEIKEKQRLRERNAMYQRRRRAKFMPKTKAIRAKVQEAEIKEALENASAKAEKLLMADNDAHIAEVVAGENKVYVDTGIFPTAERRHMADRVQGNEAEREGKNNFDDHTISAIIKSADMV